MCAGLLIFCQMDKIRGKVILVTGASAGIGAGLTKTLVNKGATVVACARNVQPIEVNKIYF